MKKILIILLVVFLFCNTVNVSAQTVSGWEIVADRPFYFVGDNMTVQVTGIVGMNYSLDLVNTTTWHNIHLTTRGIGPSGMDRFSIILDDEWVVGGIYYLNVSIDGFHMAHRLIRIEYSEEYLHNKEHDWLRDSVAWIERAIGNIYDDLGGLWDDVQMVMRSFSVLMVLVLIIGGQVFLHVIIPVFYNWARRQQFKGIYAVFRHGCTANQIQWHDRNLPAIPSDHVPNVRKLATNALAAGLTPEQGKMIVWAADGSPGDGDFVRDIMSKMKWRRLRLNAIRSLTSQGNVAGTAYKDKADEIFKEFKNNIDVLNHLYSKEVKKP